MAVGRLTAFYSMFVYKETAYYVVDYYTGESTRLNFMMYVDAFRWHESNKKDFNETTHQVTRYNYTDNRIEDTLRMEVVSRNYNECLTFLNIAE